MHKLFAPDSIVMRAMSRLCDLFFLNLFFLLSCIPVITIGAAITAMYTVCFRFDTEKESGIFKSYCNAFRNNWKQATAVWLIILLCGGSACFNCLLFSSLSGTLRYTSLVFAVLLALVLLTAGYVFPLISQFHNRMMPTLKNAFALSVGYLPRSILVTVINILPFAILLTNIYLFFQTAFIWVTIYFAAGAYLNSRLLKTILDPYLK